jgi:CheY-like chemotaxis protein
MGWQGNCSNAMTGDEETVVSGGCDGYLTKPIDTRKFVATAAAFIASANLPRTNSEAA